MTLQVFHDLIGYFHLFSSIIILIKSLEEVGYYITVIQLLSVISGYYGDLAIKEEWQYMILH